MLPENGTATGTKDIFLVKNGLRYARVKGTNNYVITQYGIVFELGSGPGFDQDGMRATNIRGYAIH